MVNASLFKSLYFFGLTLLMLMVSAVKSSGQKVYATSYGMRQSNGSLLHGRVNNPLASVDGDYSNITRLSLFTALGITHFAEYQLKFENLLPAGTPVSIRIQTNLTGLLGLLLAGNGGISVQTNATTFNENSISGTSLPQNQFLTDTTTIENQLFARVTPLQPFNAITISLTEAGLSLLELNLASAGTIDIFYAYYECPSITVSQQEPACAGHPFTLSVDNPINTNYTWYPANSPANPLGTGNTITLTETAAASKNYYLKHNQFSATCGLDTVTVNIGAIPDNPAVSLE